jgi:hypothetical protein
LIVEVSINSRDNGEGELPPEQNMKTTNFAFPRPLLPVFPLVLLFIGFLDPPIASSDPVIFHYSEEETTTTLYAFPGLQPLEDMNGDGIGDVLIEEYTDPDTSELGGERVTYKLLSGMDGSILFNQEAEANESRVTGQLYPAGDLNNDDIGDFWSTYILYSQNGVPVNGIHRRIDAISGSNNAVLYTIIPDDNEKNEFLNTPLALAGDLNGDGIQTRELMVRFCMLYTVNQRGRSLDRSQKVSVTLTGMVSTISLLMNQRRSFQQIGKCSMEQQEPCFLPLMLKRTP